MLVATCSTGSKLSCKEFLWCHYQALASDTLDYPVDKITVQKTFLWHVQVELYVNSICVTKVLLFCQSLWSIGLPSDAKGDIGTGTNSSYILVEIAGYDAIIDDQYGLALASNDPCVNTRKIKVFHSLIYFVSMGEVRSLRTQPGTMNLKIIAKSSQRNKHK